VLAVSAAASSGLGDLLTNRFTLPGTDTQRAETILEDHFGQKSTGSFSVVVASDGRARRLIPEARQAARRASEELPTSHVVSVAPVSDDVVLAQLVSELDPADAKGHTDAMREAAGSIPGAEIFVTGQAAIEHDLDPVFTEDLQKGELIAVPIALLILVFTFGTLSFLLPFVFALVTIPTTLGLIWIIANFMELTTYLTNLVTLIGLGIAIDYSLLVVYRFREELRSSPSREEAVVRTMETAGRTVVFSGTAVALGLSLLLFMPLPFIRGFGIGGLIIPTVSVVAAVTLLPVLIWFLAPRLDKARLVPKSWLERRADAARGFWARLARSIQRRPLPFAVGTTTLLASTSSTACAATSSRRPVSRPTRRCMQEADRRAASTSST
jgi:RND superfamily putative drug exporter